MKNAVKTITLLLIGGGVYCAIEMVWRGRTHPSMFILGGVCFLLVGGINEFLPWSLGLVWQSLIGAASITVAEFITGLVVNVWLNLAVWNYSGLWGNVLGQICPQFALAWVFLAAICIFADDWLRWKLFNEEKPHYTVI